MELQRPQTLAWQAREKDVRLERDSFSYGADELEGRLAEYIGAEHCVSVESATTGLLIALKAAGIEAGDSVLYTSFSYLALAGIITLAGGVPVPVDINPNTYNIDPYCLEYAIGKCLRTKRPVPKALIAVDLFGMPCNYGAIEEICERHGISLIEDMAQSFGAELNGKRTGSFGRMAVASFFPSKPFDDMGEGGAVFCRDEGDARRLRSLRKRIQLRQSQCALYNTGGYLDTVQASVAAEKLEDFGFELECRREVAERYRARLGGHIKTQQAGEGFSSAYTQFVISPPNRAGLIEHLRASHIPCHVFEPSPLPGRGADSDWSRVTLVNAKAVSSKLLALPIHPYLSRRVVEYICDRVLEGAVKSED